MGVRAQPAASSTTHTAIPGRLLAFGTPCVGPRSQRDIQCGALVRPEDPASSFQGKSTAIRRITPTFTTKEARPRPCANNGCFWGMCHCIGILSYWSLLLDQNVYRMIPKDCREAVVRTFGP